jgi:CheY-like chemotaxis protein
MKRWVDHDRIVCESLMSKNTGEQILVVDDEAIRWTLSEALQSWGCAAIEAGPRSKSESEAGSFRLDLTIVCQLFTSTFALDVSPCAKESLRLAVDVCPMDLRSKDPLSGRGHQVLLIPGLPEVRFH